MSLLVIEKLSLKIGSVPIFRDSDLSIVLSEVIGLVGESGSGKSMTALATMQLALPSARAEGLITFDGIDILNATEP